MKIYYNQNLIKLARKLRNDSTQSEIKLWSFLKGEKLPLAKINIRINFIKLLEIYFFASASVI